MKTYSQSIVEFVARGGKIKPSNQQNSDTVSIKFCNCGCRGDFSEHRLRSIENFRSK